MTTFISPGVYTLEQDLSQYVSNLSSTIVAMVGTSDMGPTETPTLVTSASQYVSLFGQPNPNHYLGYAALSYLEQGNQLYVTRVAPSDASVAKLTVPLPASYTPYSGNWTLSSNTATTATFTVSNSTGATGANQLVVLPTTPPVTLSGFDFTDTTNVAAINGKVGSDLSSFISSGLVNSYVVGRSFTVNTGYGKGSSVPVTNLAVDDLADLYLTVDATKFNSFNSPILATATGSFLCTTKAVSGAIAAETVVIGSTSNGTTTGTLSLVLTTTGTPNATPTLTNINSYVSVASPNVTITIPMFYTGTGGTGTITAANAANNALSISAVLNGIISAFAGGSSSLTGNLATAYPLCAATFDGVTGLGYINPVTGASAGLSSATVQSDGLTIVLAGITLGASSTFSYGTNAGPFVSTTNMQITGTFSLNLSRPTWVMNAAGSSFVPTFLKFSSLGEADFSNVAITVDLNLNNVDASDEQQYVVSLYTRGTGLSISPSSVYQSDFVLTEQYTGTPDVLQSTINSSSAYVSLKIDYATVDTLNYTSGVITNGTPSDNLTPSFGLFTDASGLGVITGAVNTTSSNIAYPSYAAFLENGSTGTIVDNYTIIGDAADKTGIYSVSDPEAIDINLLVVPGWSADPAVAAAMISLCQNRSDCMCILDTPYGLSVQEAINYRNNVLVSGSNYAAVYYPWVQVVDSVNKVNLFVPPSGMVSAQYAYNDSVGAVYTAPAGRNRGNLLNATAVERILNQGDRDALTLAQINPIYSEAGYGIYIRGQMTLQRATTALNRVNVRRLLLYLRKVISTASKYFEFEPGDSVTALRLKQLAESTLQAQQNLGAIRNFTVDVGSDVNTSQVLENNELVMSISIVPTKTAEIIVEVFNILPQGQGITINNA